MSKFNNKIKFSNFQIFISIFILFSLDILSKLLFCSNIFTSSLNCVLNTGSAWNLFVNLQNYAILIGILGILISIILIIKKKDIIKESNVFVFIFIISGILGNSINRIFNLGVHDMISIYFLPFFGIFNLADLYISIGIILFLINEFYVKKLIFITK